MLIVFSSHRFPMNPEQRHFHLVCLPQRAGIWSVPIAGNIGLPPQVINGVLYLTTTTISLEAPATPTSQSSMLPQVGTIGNLLQRGVPNDGSQLWRQTTQQGMSDNAYVTNGSINDGSGAVYAFRASGGSLLWHHLMYWVVYNPPVLVGSTIYVSTARGEVYAPGKQWHSVVAFHTNVQ